MDRTGTLESKRKKRMKMLNVQTDEKTETFETLSKKSTELSSEIDALKERLSKAQEALKHQADSVDLDDFMDTIKESADAGSKENISKLKLQLSTLHKEKQRVDKLVEVTRPNKIPDLKAAQAGRAKVTFGKMFGSKAAVPAKPVSDPPQPKVLARPKAFDDEEDEEVAKRPKLQSLEKLKKDIEEEKSRPVVMEQPKKKKDKPRKPAQQPTTANMLQQVIETDAAPKSYSELANDDEKYQTWVPPKGQTGDGRTSLNEKLGY